MPRLARLKIQGGEDGWYHLYSRIAGKGGEYPLEDFRCRTKMTELFKFYANAYCCGVSAYSIMGSHWHLVVRFEKIRKLGKDELWERALRLYPRSEKLLKNWSPGQWKRLQNRLFDVSEFMRNIQAAFARWYNRLFKRKGRFWADRFKSTLLMDSEAVLDAMLYVDLNGVRAGLVQRPEDFVGCSAHLRESGKASWLLPLSEVMNKGLSSYYREYKGLLYYRGAVPTKSHQAAIPMKLLQREEERGFKESGVYLKKLRYFTDGLALGASELVLEQLARLRDVGQFLRRKNPIPQEDGCQHSLREQRSNFVSLE